MNILSKSKSMLLIFKFSFQRTHSFHLHRMSKLFPPIKDGSLDKKTESISNTLMLDHNIISSLDNGLYTLLPLGLRSIEKLINIIDLQMKKVGCYKLYLPHLTSASLWKKTGRYEDSTEIFLLKDKKHHEYILSPTHEEAITSLISSFQPIAHSRLPIYLYQISTKFRDELRPKHGLLRTREFLMKDLYTFDKDLIGARSTYDNIVKIYCEIFNDLKLPFEKVKALVGPIGGIESNEFHILNDIGEDFILSCTNCGYKANKEMVGNQDNNTCQSCGATLILNKGIEVGHAFLLGTKYSKPLSAIFKDVDGDKLMYMGCYGIGVTRLLAAGLEALSEEKKLRWPKSLAPFKVCIITPKKGSKEDEASHWCYHLEQLINDIENYEGEVIVDDRSKLTIGKRYKNAESFGFPVIIIVGKLALNDIPMFEVTHENKKMVLNQSDLLSYLKNS